MIEVVDLVLIGITAAFSALLASVTGSGGTTILLPVLVLFFGIRDGVAIITIANLAANLSRVVIHREEVVLPVVGWFALGAVPASLLGAYLFVIAPPDLLIRLLGVVLIGVALWRRLRPSPPTRQAVVWFLPIGTTFGFLEGIIGSTGPLMAPFFLAFGLMKGAYIGTDALATVAMQATKLSVFGSAELLGARELAIGLALVPCMIAGTLLGRRILDRVSERAFSILVEIMIVAAGLNFLVRG